MYEGSMEQRCMSEQTTLENGIPTWILNDQGRVYGTKGKFALWPNLSISRDTGMTVVGRIRCVDEPAGWYNTTQNFGINLPDCPDAGLIIRPDYVQFSGPSVNGPGQSISNGYSYHTYTLTLKNATPGNSATAAYNMYRDGILLSSTTQGPAGSCFWTGPYFGHWRSDATGGWAWQWIAWNATGAYVPSAGATLTMTAAHYSSSYYLHVRGFNSDGVPSGTLDLGPYYYWNGSDLLTPTVTDDGAYTTRYAIHASWTPAGPSIIRYEYAIGTSPGAENTLPYTSAGMALEVTRNELNLSEGQTYYVSVRGVSAGGNGPVGSSDGITVAPTVNSIGQAKRLTDGSPAALYGKIVTAVFPDCAYIQKPSGAGIRIVTARPMNVGDTVDIAGVMAGASDERRVNADTVIQGESASIEPRGMPGRAIGGRDFLYNEASGQRGVKGYMKGSQSGVYILGDMPGLNNIGSLVRTWGKVTSVGTDEFYLDDGSGYSDYSAGSPKGVKVVMPQGAGTPALNSYVSLTAIVSYYKSGDTFYRLLRVRQVGDVLRLL